MSGRVLVVVVCALFVGCGGDDAKFNPDGEGSTPALGRPAEVEEVVRDLGFPAIATRNTTRVAGPDPVANAAGVARAVYPGVAADSRPGSVTLVDVGDFPAAVSAAQLMAAPLSSPILFSVDGDLPQATQDALDAIQPIGAEAAGDAQVFRVGDAAATPAGLEATAIAGDKPAAIARAIDRVATEAAGEQSEAVIVASLEDPEFAMPAAGLSTKTGAPVLWTEADALPEVTVQTIESRKQPRIYVVGPEEVVSEKVFEQLEKLGPTDRIAGENPVENAIAVARYADGAFGWNVVDPGHGLVFAGSATPADAPAAAALSGSGKYGPLLLVSEPDALETAVEGYLLDIQPGYDADPVRGVYNHAWVLGDEAAISVAVQARIDSLLEIQSVTGEG
ncbi:MAG: cell wall-binding repeat-containing protein [Solirubrobacteraceae bacterium]